MGWLVQAKWWQIGLRFWRWRVDRRGPSLYAQGFGRCGPPNSLTSDYPSQMAMEQWPKDRPWPTVDEVRAAKERWRAEATEAYAAGYLGDWGYSFDFLMATYSRPCWWHLYFPDEQIMFDTKED
jgi:hypothetical protein